MFRSIYILSNLHNKKLSMINKNLPKSDNEYKEVDKKTKKEIIKRIRKKLLTNKIGNTIMILGFIEIIVLVILYLTKQLGLEIDKNGMIVFLILLFFPILSILLSFKIKNIGMIKYICSIVNTKIKVDDNMLTFSYSSLYPNITEEYIRANYCIKQIKYKDIKKIEKDSRKNKYTFYGDFLYREFINYNEEKKETSNNYIDINKENDKFIIYDFYEDKDLFNIIEKKSGISINEKKTRNPEKKLKIFTLTLFTIMMIIATPLSIIYVNNTKDEIEQNNTEKVKIENNDYIYFDKIIKEELGENAHIKYYPDKITIQKVSKKEQVIRLISLAYNDENNGVYCFIFYKYITESDKHKIGDLELNMSYVSTGITKNDLEKE